MTFYFPGLHVAAAEADTAPQANVAHKSVTYDWSGRGDLNARPPAPKTDLGLLPKYLIFNYLRFNKIRASG